LAQYILIITKQSSTFLKKTQKHALNQRGSSGSIPSIEITKENVESGDYISDESEYQEGGNGDRDRRNSCINNNGPPSPMPSQYAQHQSPQHQYHQPQVRWMKNQKKTFLKKNNVLPEHNVLCYIPIPSTSDCLCIYLTLNKKNSCFLFFYFSFS
jgi:hypothetical protein